MDKEEERERYRAKAKGATLWRDNLDENAATIRMAILAVAARG
jgi:hypothetical protein